MLFVCLWLCMCGVPIESGLCVLSFSCILIVLSLPLIRESAVRHHQQQQRHLILHLKLRYLNQNECVNWPIELLNEISNRMPSHCLVQISLTVAAKSRFRTFRFLWEMSFAVAFYKIEPRATTAITTRNSYLFKCTFNDQTQSKPLSHSIWWNAHGRCFQ